MLTPGQPGKVSKPLFLLNSHLPVTWGFKGTPAAVRAASCTHWVSPGSRHPCCTRLDTQAAQIIKGCSPQVALGYLPVQPINRMFSALWVLPHGHFTSSLWPLAFTGLTCQTG